MSSVLPVFNIIACVNEEGIIGCNNDLFIKCSEDMKRFKYLKRLLKRYVKGEQIRYHLVLNHLIVLYNVFDDAATPLLFYSIEQQYWGILKTFLIYLNKYPIGLFPEIDTELEIELALKEL